MELFYYCMKAPKDEYNAQSVSFDGNLGPIFPKYLLRKFKAYYIDSAIFKEIKGTKFRRLLKELQNSVII